MTTFAFTTMEIESVGQCFHALSDPLRLQIIELLRNEELCVCDLCEQLDVGQSKLSFHLKNLRDAQLVISRQEGRWMYYRLNLPQFDVLQTYLAEFQHFRELNPIKSCS
jgi:ArsR family transcriptional regulator